MPALHWLTTHLVIALTVAANAVPSAGPPATAAVPSASPTAAVLTSDPSATMASVTVASTPADLCARVAYAAAFRGDSLVTAVAVALAESSCDPLARGINSAAVAGAATAQAGPVTAHVGTVTAQAGPAGVMASECTASVDRGLFQLNSCAHPAISDACAYDAQCNADSTYDISLRGTNWSPWRAVFDNGSYREKLAEATAAVERLGIDRQPVCRPVTGDWDANRSVTMGLACRPETGQELRWELINVNGGGSPQIHGHYGIYGCVPVTGDWNGDGRDTIGVACRDSDGQISWSLSNGFSGSPSYSFRYGGADRCWPVTGDWDGNGRTSVGVACRTRGSIEISWSLINSLSGGSPSYPVFGYGSTGCRPVTGDWDGDRDTTVGVACPSDGEIRWSLINSLSGGSPSYPVFGFGSSSGCWPTTGDWDGNRTTTIGIVCAGTSLTWALMNVHSGGTPQIRTGFGPGQSYESTSGWYGPDWPHWPTPY